ncbi:MAG TPA: epoxide hydrolase [Acidimicrobiia bacterium]
MPTIEPFRVDVPDPVLGDLHDRLRRTRFPNQIAGAGWTQGAELGYLRELVGYWLDGYDWRTHEARLNAFSQHTTEIDGQRIHFVHARAPEPDALPLLLVHGWPGSVVEFLDVLGPLSDPRAHRGAAADAFHVVAPSLPGYAFSGPTRDPGWHPRRIAAAFVQLMADLGYDRYGAQGGDWGSVVCANVADLDADHVAGLHLNFVVVPPPEGDSTPLTPEEQRGLDAMRTWRRSGAGYQEIQGTKPQTIGYLLDDSPAGLAAWIVEKFAAWSDCDGDVERSFTKDQLLTNVMAYWVTTTATSSVRLYYEMREAGSAAVPADAVGVPTGVANYPAEITRMPRRWVEQRYNIVHWSEPPRGGHFAAMEVPGLFVDDLRTFFRPLR